MNKYFNTIDMQENKEKYITPDCKIYEIEIECLLNISGDSEIEPEYGGESGFPQSSNFSWD